MHGNEKQGSLSPGMHADSLSAFKVVDADEEACNDKGGVGVTVTIAGVVVAALFLLVCGPLQEVHTPPTPATQDYDPCCSFPCQHQGICMSLPNNSYLCDCTLTSHYGTNCEIPTWGAWLKQKLRPDPETVRNLLTSYPLLWTIVNNIPFLHSRLTSYVYLSHEVLIDSPPTYESDHHYITLDTYFNSTYYSRCLPPVPTHCPTPMGVAGPKQYPDVDEVIKRVFLRREFKPEPHNSNGLLIYYAQHFTHQFFRTDFKRGPHLTTGTSGVDVSHIYGSNEHDRRALRSRVNGKLRTQLINGEEFPPYLKDVPGITMGYPSNVSIPETQKFALGHPFFALLPGLFMFATIWVREHNRVCDELLKIHPDWDDERLYHTARLIIVAETIKITIEDYVQHLSQYKLRLIHQPELLHGTFFQFQNRIYAEFDHLYHWHPMIPPDLEINSTTYSLKDMIYSTVPILKHGLDNFIHAMVNSRSGALTYRNHPRALYHVIRKLIEHSRQLRIQGFNAYRRRFEMKPHTSFLDFTDDPDLASELEHLYGDIEAVEFYVGLIVGSPGSSVTPVGMNIMGGPMSIKGLLANPINSPRYWKPSTFGGVEGFQIVKTASFKRLFCLNMKTECKNIAFVVPPGTP